MLYVALDYLLIYLCDAVRSIYTDRTDTVSERGERSGKSRQERGICQGCPLSPYLFIIVMALLMHDAKGWMSNQCIAAMERGRLYDILYADGGLLRGCSPHHLEGFAHAVERAGSSYGMALHGTKTRALSVATEARLKNPDGKYWALLSRDGRMNSELFRKLGCARADFLQLQRLWGHSRISIEEKIKYLDSFVLSRLNYGLAIVCIGHGNRRCARKYNRKYYLRNCHHQYTVLCKISQSGGEYTS